MFHRVYHSPGESAVYKNLGRARREFTGSALRQERVALVIENGLNYQVTFNEPTSNLIIVRHFPDYHQIFKYLNEVF
jgi:hypothetical protein